MVSITQLLTYTTRVTAELEIYLFSIFEIYVLPALILQENHRPGFHVFSDPVFTIKPRKGKMHLLLSLLKQNMVGYLLSESIRNLKSNIKKNILIVSLDGDVHVHKL